MSKVSVNRTEYEALVYLRDVAFEELRVKCLRLERLVKQLEELEKQSSHMINEQSITMEHWRDKCLEQHDLILKMQKRLQQLEPVRSEVPQPMFARK